MADESTEESAAIVTIKEASMMTGAGRKMIADWLRQEATNLEQKGDQYGDLYRGRYVYQNWSKTSG